MEIDPTTEEGMYRIMTSVIVPRPVGWISSRSADGADNLAPYSFFNGMNEESPPVIMFSAEDVAEGHLKDSVENICETGEFVHNLVTMDLVEQMHETSDTVDPGVSEFDHAGLASADSEVVDAPRVADAKANLECRLYDDVRIGDHVIVMGEVVHIHLDDSILNDVGKVDVRKVDAVGRLTGELYASLEPFSVDD
ncbi:flavin reductase family protein [Halobacteriales archaeon Cl-PHB]